MICVNDPGWMKRLTVLRLFGRQSSLFGEKENSEALKNRFRQKPAGTPYDSKYIFSEVGYNMVPLEISSAFALEQLKKLPKFAEIRERNFNNLYKFFQNYLKYFTLSVQTPQTETIWLAFPLIINKNAPFTRIELVKFLEENNIQTRPISTGNILKQPGFKNIPHRLARKTYPNTEHVMQKGLVVGSHHGLSPKQISYM